MRALDGVGRMVRRMSFTFTPAEVTRIMESNVPELMSGLQRRSVNLASTLYYVYRRGETTTEDMSNDTGLSRSNVQFRLSKLYNFGFLIREKKSMPGRKGYVYLYKLNPAITLYFDMLEAEGKKFFIGDYTILKVLYLEDSQTPTPELTPETTTV